MLLGIPYQAALPFGQPLKTVPSGDKWSVVVNAACCIHLSFAAFQKQQSPDENRDRHGNMVWYCCSGRSHTAISHYADYQATSFQECLKVLANMCSVLCLQNLFATLVFRLRMLSGFFNIACFVRFHDIFVGCPEFVLWAVMVGFSVVVEELVWNREFMSLPDCVLYHLFLFQYMVL